MGFFLHVALIHNYNDSRRNDLYNGLVGLWYANKTFTNKYDETIRYVFESFGIVALLNEMMVWWLRVFGIKTSLMIFKIPTSRFERVMQVLLYIKISSWKCKGVGTYGIVIAILGIFLVHGQYRVSLSQITLTMGVNP